MVVRGVGGAGAGAVIVEGGGTRGCGDVLSCAGLSLGSSR